MRVSQVTRSSSTGTHGLQARQTKFSRKNLFSNTRIIHVQVLANKGKRSPPGMKENLRATKNI